MFARFLCPSRRKLRQVRAVLFDLDGTLLRVSMSAFVPAYIDGLARHLTDLVPAPVFAGTARTAVQALLSAADGGRTNEEAFAAQIAAGTGVPPEVLRRRLGRFYADGLARLEELVRPLPLGAEVVRACRQRGLRTALATNPVFPRPVIEARLRWGGLDGVAFDLLTSYENTHYCKPHPGYFLAVARQLGVAPEQCLMVGNDTDYDLGAHHAGMLTFLADTCLEDRLGGGWHADFRGDLDALLQLVPELGGWREN